jgi:hypothetical protein
VATLGPIGFVALSIVVLEAFIGFSAFVGLASDLAMSFLSFTLDFGLVLSSLSFSLFGSLDGYLVGCFVGLGFSS